VSLSLKISKARALGYRGDPGLFSFLGKAVKGIAGAILPAIPGGSLINSVVQGIGGTKASALPMLQSIPGVKTLQGLSKNFPVPNLPLLPGGGMGIANDLGLTTRGMKKDGTPRRIKSNGQPWKRPSMNYANGRAIRRAARRLEGAEKMFRKVFTIRHGKHPAGVHPKA